MADENCPYYEWLWDELITSTHGDHYCKINRAIYERGRCEHDYFPECPIYLAHKRRLEQEVELEIEREKIMSSVPHSD